jgi:hypothetical protein
MTDPLNDPAAAEIARLLRRNAELELDLSAARKAIPKPAAPNLITRPEPPSFRRSDLKDAAFFAAHRRDILDAAVHGRILDDMPGWHAGGNSPSMVAQRAARQARKEGAK